MLEKKNLEGNVTIFLEKLCGKKDYVCIFCLL